MQNDASFREIFIAHLSQNSSLSETNPPNFDHTLYEIPRITIKKPISTNARGPLFYQKELKKYPIESPLKKPTQQPNERPPQAEFILTMKQLKSPDHMAAASIVTGYLGENEFIPRTMSQLKKAYRQMILKEHPDHGGNLETFPQILEAFRVLLDIFVKIEKDSH